MALQLLDSERYEVLRFLSAWRNWILSGANERHKVFARYRGLCISARYAVQLGLFDPGLPVWLGTMLLEDFGDEDFPFNTASQSTPADKFQGEMSRKTAHLNSARRGWVDQKLMGTQFDVTIQHHRPRGNVLRHSDPFTRSE